MNVRQHGAARNIMSLYELSRACYDLREESKRQQFRSARKHMPPATNSPLANARCCSSWTGVPWRKPA